MVLTVNARLDEATVFVGERVRCTLYIHNSDESKTEDLAWGSAQLYCSCSHSRSKVKLPSSEVREAPSNVHASSPVRGNTDECTYFLVANNFFLR